MAAAPFVARVRLLGEELVLRGEDTARLVRLAADLDTRLKQYAEAMGLRAQPTKTVMLVALNLHEELERVRGDLDRLERATAAATASMVERIDSTLEPEDLATG